MTGRLREERVRWVLMSWREPFMWQRLLVMLTFSLGVSAICLAYQAGVLGLLAIALGAWPWPVRVAVGDFGVRLRWWFVNQTLSASEISAVELAPDDRRWAWPRALALRVERRPNTRVMIFGSRATLERIAAAVERLGWC